jgi:hypothetical protein
MSLDKQFPGRIAKGISAQALHRTVLEILTSHYKKQKAYAGISLHYNSNLLRLLNVSVSPLLSETFIIKCPFLNSAIAVFEISLLFRISIMSTGIDSPGYLYQHKLLQVSERKPLYLLLSENTFFYYFRKPTLVCYKCTSLGMNKVRHLLYDY